MTERLRLPDEATVIVRHLVIDDGTDRTPGPPVAPMSVPISDLKGSKLYDTLIGLLPEWEAQYAADEAARPNRAARRAKPKTRP